MTRHILYVILITMKIKFKREIEINISENLKYCFDCFFEDGNYESNYCNLFNEILVSEQNGYG